MSWPEEDWLLPSGLQRFAFCRRQWTLVHIENQWAGSYRTVEYKRGRPKEHRADELQLCAQAMCLEEMLCCLNDLCLPKLMDRKRVADYLAANLEELK